MDDSLRDSLPGHLPLIRGIVRRMAPGAGLSDDLTQECCVRLIEKEALWRERASPRPWIRAVTRNLALRRLGQFRNRRRLEMPLPAEPEANAGSDPVEEQIAWLLSQFALLPPKQQEVLKMRYFESLETPEIARRMGISESTVATHHARALETMKRKAKHAGWLPGILAWLALNKIKVGATAAALAVAGGGAAYFFTTDPSTHLISHAADLKKTVIVAHPDAPMPPGKNVLYCASFQLAWNELKGFAGGPIQFEEPTPLTDNLNAGKITRGDVAPGGLVAMAGRLDQGIVKRVNAELQRVFGQGPDPALQGDPVLDRAPPESILAYAFLATDLKFPIPFEPLDAMPFGAGGEKVEAFGYKKLRTGYLEQVDLYQTQEGYVVALQTADPQEEILLARVKPGETLAKTIEAALRIRSGEARSLPDSESLKIPLLDFDLTHSYEELLDKDIMGPGPASGGCLVKALQTIRFKLDEHGATLRSRALIEWMCKRDEEIQSLTFDRPFLLMLHRKGSREPYFALWIENPEILVGAGKRRESAPEPDRTAADLEADAREERVMSGLASPQETEDYFLERYRESGPKLRDEALRMLFEVGHPEAKGILARRLEEDGPLDEILSSCLDDLDAETLQENAKALARLSADAASPFRVRLGAFLGLYKVDRARALAAIMTGFARLPEEDRLLLTYRIGSFSNHPEALAILADIAASDPSERVRDVAGQAAGRQP